MTKRKYQDRWRWTGVAVVIAPDFLHTFDVGAKHPRAVALLDKVQILGYTRDKAGVSTFQQHHGLEESGMLDWRTILVIDSLTGSPERPRLSAYSRGLQV